MQEYILISIKVTMSSSKSERGLKRSIPIPIPIPPTDAPFRSNPSPTKPFPKKTRQNALFASAPTERTTSPQSSTVELHLNANQREPLTDPTNTKTNTNIINIKMMSYKPNNKVGMSIWNVKDIPKTITLFGKHSSNVVWRYMLNKRDTLDTLLIEAVHACLLAPFSFSVKFYGILKDYSTPRFSTGSPESVAIFSYEGNCQLFDQCKSFPEFLDPSSKLLDAFATFLDDYESVALLYGMSHNDMHSNNIMINNNRFKLIDYGRMHMHHIPTNSPNHRKEMQADFLNQCFDVREPYNNTQIDIISNYPILFNPTSNMFALKKPYMVNGMYINYLFDLASLSLNIYEDMYANRHLGSNKTSTWVPFHLHVRSDGVFIKLTEGFFDNQNGYPKEYTELKVYPLLELIDPYLRFIYDYVVWVTQQKSQNPYNDFISFESLSIHTGSMVFVNILTEGRMSEFLDHVITSQQGTCLQKYASYYHFGFSILNDDPSETVGGRSIVARSMLPHMDMFNANKIKESSLLPPKYKSNALLRREKLMSAIQSKTYYPRRNLVTERKKDILKACEGFLLKLFHKDVMISTKHS